MDQHKTDATIQVWDDDQLHIATLDGVAHVFTNSVHLADWTFWNATFETADDLTAINDAFDNGLRAKMVFRSDDESIEIGYGLIVFIRRLGVGAGCLIGVAGMTEITPGRDLASAITMVYDLFDAAGREIELKVPDDQRVIEIRYDGHDFRVGFDEFLQYISDAYDYGKDHGLGLIDVVEDALDQLRLDQEDETL